MMGFEYVLGLFCILILAYMIGRMFGLGLGTSLRNTIKPVRKTIESLGQKEKKDETVGT